MPQVCGTIRFAQVFLYLGRMNMLDQYRDEIARLCKVHKVGELSAFGSVVTGHFNESSDIDLLIRFEDVEVLEYFDNYMDLKESLEHLFRRPVDLVEDQAIRNPVFRKIIDRDKFLVYERKGA